MTFILAAPAAGAEPTRGADATKVAPPRDLVIDEPRASAARISATASAVRYPINDGTGATIAVAVTSACQSSCTAADPQRIANFVGSLLHGPEVELLTVQLDAPFQIDFDCGYGAQACYYPSENRIVLNGNDTLSRDGASREYVLAHEYGHHVANHRDSPAPFPAAIDWGTPRWSSHERICQARRRGVLFPGDQGLRYHENPGEAFAEAFARYHFPDSGVRWRWAGFLRPDAAAFRAIREDTLHPWQGRNGFRIAGRAPPRARGASVKWLRTPLDGMVSLRPSGPSGRRYQLSLRSSSGETLRSSRSDLSMRGQLNFTVCGQSRLRVQLESIRRSAAPYELLIQRP
jgi:hypothetical protein